MTTAKRMIEGCSLEVILLRFAAFAGWNEDVILAAVFLDIQPRSQGFSLLNWVADPIQKGKALGTRLARYRHPSQNIISSPLLLF